MIQERYILQINIFRSLDTRTQNTIQIIRYTIANYHVFTYFTILNKEVLSSMCVHTGLANLTILILRN